MTRDNVGIGHASSRCSRFFIGNGSGSVSLSRSVYARTDFPYNFSIRIDDSCEFSAIDSLKPIFLPTKRFPDQRAGIRPRLFPGRNFERNFDERGFSTVSASTANGRCLHAVRRFRGWNEARSSETKVKRRLSSSV